MTAAQSSVPEESTQVDLYTEACAAHAAGQLGVAEAIYRQVLRQQPTHADGQHKLGALLVQTHAAPGADHGETSRLLLSSAFVHLRAAIHARPGCARFRHTLGVAHMACGRAADAVEAFERANEKDPMNVQILLSLGKALQGVSRFGRAAEVYRSITMLEPGHAKAHYRRGTCLRQAGRQAEALAAFRHHLRLFPDDEQTAFWIAAMAGDAGAMGAMPAGLVAGLFDQYADKFDDHLVNSLQYRTPQVLMDAIIAAGGPRNAPPRWTRCVDLGCGTGLMGPLLRPHLVGGVLEGCDLSAGMHRL
ncbi:hypothetical protein FOA52_012186 [Chlamydomonas sp. UWO 241]|nr:hypothetical protein FOA52_012186 [Chlamydomonas sp. UWO 241]